MYKEFGLTYKMSFHFNSIDFGGNEKPGQKKSPTYIHRYNKIIGKLEKTNSLLSIFTPQQIENAFQTGT